MNAAVQHFAMGMLTACALIVLAAFIWEWFALRDQSTEAKHKRLTGRE